MQQSPNAPVVELALGVQFGPLTEFRNAHLGLFWKFLNRNGVWPETVDVASVEPRFEEFSSKRGIVFEFRMAQAQRARIRILRSTKDQMIQLQSDRITLHWTGKGGDKYPGFEAINHDFLKILESFKGFLESEKVSNDIHYNQWEIQYINHIKKGTVWNEMSDVPEIFNSNILVDKDGDILPENIGATWIYEITPQFGRLYVELKAVQTAGVDHDETLILNLLSRGAIDESQSLENCLSRAHQVMNNHFIRITSDKVRQYWRGPA